MELKKPVKDINLCLQDTLIGQAAYEASLHNEFPLQTATLMTLGLVSHVVQMSFCSVFKSFRELPSGLYVVSEQGKAASKSPLFDAIKGHVDDYISEWNKTIIKDKREALRELDSRSSKGGPGNEYLEEEVNKSPIELFVTNATPEALEAKAGKQGGLFSVASTEKTILNVLFGNAYGDKNSSVNLELPLSGFVGEKPKVLRIKRDGILTRASGAISILSQPGTVQSILAASSNTGLSERFLMIVEPRITKKQLEEFWSKEVPEGKPYLRMLQKIMRKVVDIAKSQKSLEIKDRRSLTFSRESTEFLEEYRRNCKLNSFKDSNPFSNELIVGYLLKSDMQIMKIATNLHVVEHLINGNVIPDVIDHKYVDMASNVVALLLKSIPEICEDIGLIGDNSLVEVIENYLKGKGRKDAKAIYNSVRKNEKFLAIPTRIRKSSFNEALDKAVRTGVIRMVPISYQGNLIEAYSI